MQTLIWIVVFRDSPLHPQQEITRYTKEAATKFASDVITDGGVAVVIEDTRETEDDTGLKVKGRSNLQW